jgi:hypothetical protein
VKATTERRVLAALALARCAAALAACGGSDGDEEASPSPTTSSSDARDSARVRLIQCLREQGIDIPDDIGESGAPLPNIDDDALEAALEGPCAELRHAAADHGHARPRQLGRGAHRRPRGGRCE